MNTPICDFAQRYADSGALRLHMPGHKGNDLLGFERLDLTEIDGADDLYHPSGIIAESEANASELFGCQTLYSTEGSSLCIRAMVLLLCQYAKLLGRRPLIAAGRNAHKSFFSAAALTGAEVHWLCPEKPDAYLSCRLSAGEIDRALSAMVEKPVAVYLTSPDYLGNLLDLGKIAQVCHKHGVLLAVDSAHGAYLRFLPESLHPMDLGADICCDSAHKTLSAITGSAYLHVGPNAPELFHTQARDALAMFGSTSPSYLILQSLDRLNRDLAEGYRERLSAFLPKTQTYKSWIRSRGYVLLEEEPLKITIDAKARGHLGTELAERLEKQGIFAEFADPDFLVLMLTPETGEDGLHRLAECLAAIPLLSPIRQSPPAFHLPEQAMSIRDAAMSPWEMVPASKSLGRILARANVGCPPAVPIVCCGERIDEEALACFAYYGIEACPVVL